MTHTISNQDDLIDSRDVIARIEELESLKADHDAEPDGGHFSDEDALELRDLRALAKEAEDYCMDWQYGGQLIRDSYFKQFAMELADDIGAIKDNAEWPYTCIDWNMAARDLQMDYASIDFGGITYWVR